jgi:hypothetical protein
MSALTKLERARATIDRLKSASAHGAKIGAAQVLAGGGGLIAGAIDAKFSKIPNTNLDTAGVLGGLAALAAMSGYVDEHSDNLGALAGGMLAYVLGREAREYFAGT